MIDHSLAIQIGRILQIASGGFWIIAYLLILYKGFQDRKSGMPLAAICANITWEAIFTLLFPIDATQTIINFVWLALDFLILLQYLAYSKMTPNKYFIVAASLAAAFLINLGITVEFQDWIGRYTAFGMNFMMSLLFILLLQSQGTLGQSIYIGYAKFLGSLCASVIFYYLFPNSSLLLILISFITILDIVYIILLKQSAVKRVGYMFHK
ncbi:transmembrane-type terpene cyclase [Paenibacillus aestuarii]|uniref:Uncharacterized protein n=1 Tax=Paenibacillus aestuarii TaxID=516965 RepID=A0ABW0KBW2_9BACL|nr:hypothetical protein [Paenibacillus aestuarii]